MKILALELSTARGSIAWLDENLAEPAEAGQLLQREEAIGAKVRTEGARRGELIDPIGCPSGAKRVDHSLPCQRVPNTSSARFASSGGKYFCQ